MAQLQFNINPALTQLKTIAEVAEKTALTAQEAFAKTNLTVGTSGVNTSAMTAQQAMINSITAQGEAQRATTVAQGEAKVNKTMADAALSRQKIITEEMKAELLTVEQALAKEKLAYMTVREQAFSEKPQGFTGLMERRLSWLFGGGLILGGMAGLSGLISTIKDVEMGMTTIARVTEDATFSFEGMRDELQQLGVTYGDTWDDVSDIATKWAQAGYGMNDTIELTKDSLLALNTAELNSEQATSGLIAIMSQWGLTTDELLPTIDKINKVADDFAITSTDLVNGLQRSSGAAKVLGLSLNETIAILTTMREATGRTGKEVGNALNSILSFMQRPTAIKAFETEGIQVFADEARTQFRSVINIFDEMAQKWPQMSEASRNAMADQAEAAGLYSEEMAEMIGLEEQYSDIQQRDLSQAAAGIYRRNYLLALLQNWSKVDEVLISQEDSLGYSMKENERTMQTLEKQIEVLKASAEQLAVALGDSGLLNEITALVEGVTDGIQWFNNLDDTMQTILLTFTEVTLAVKLLSAAFKGFGVSGALSAAGGLMAGWTVPIGATTAATRVLAGALTGIKALLTNIGRVGIAALGGPVVAGIIAVGTAAVATARHISQVNGELIKNGEYAEGLVGDYDSLTSKLSGMQKGTAEYQKTSQELSEISRGLADNIPELVEGYDEETNSIKINREKMGELIESSKELKRTTEELREVQEAEIKALQEQEQTHNQQASYYENQKSVAEDLAERRDKLTATLAKQTAGSEEAKKTQEALGETERLLGDIAEEAGLQRNAATDDVIAKLGELKKAELEGVKNTQESERDKLQAVKDAALARITIIQQEMAVYNNPASWGFGTAAGNFLKQLNPLNSYNYDPDKPETLRNLNEDNLQKYLAKDSQAAKDAQDQIDAYNKKIKETENTINKINADAIIKPSSSSSGITGSGSSKTDDWLTTFLDKTLAAAEAQSKLNDAKQRAIDIDKTYAELMIDSAMTMDEYFQGMKAQAGMAEKLESLQSGNTAEANAYRQAITALQAKQKTLNTSTDEGKEAYDKIGDEIENCKQKVDELTKSYYELEKEQRAVYGEQVKGVLDMLSRVKDLGADMNDIEGKYLASIQLDNLTLSDRIDILKQIEDYMKEILETAIDTQIADLQAQKDAAKATSDARIESIQDEIDALQEEKDLQEQIRQEEDAKKEIAEAELELEEAKQKLLNVQNEKNTRLYQNGEWTYVADPAAVRDAEEAIEDAQDRLADAREALADLYEQMMEDELDAQLEAEKQQQEESDKYYDEQIKKLEDSKNDIVKQMLANGDSFQAILNQIFSDKLTPELKGQLEIMKELVEQYVADMLDKLSEITGESGIEYGEDTEGSYASGGYITYAQKAQLHGNEYVLNSPTVNALGGKTGVENLVSSLRFPKAVGAGNIVTNSSSSSVTTIDKGVSISNLNLPNIYDVSGFLRNLKSLAG